MKIVIPDDYQDMVDQLECFSLIRHHDVICYSEPARDLTQLVERLCDADVVVSIRERVEFSRALLERLPKLKLIALVGRNSKMIDFAACTELGIAVATGKCNSPAAPAELALALIVASRLVMDRAAPPQRGARSRTHEARRMALHAVASAARVDARHFRPRRHRAVGRAGRPRARNGCPGLGSKILLGASGRRGICERREQR